MWVRIATGNIQKRESRLRGCTAQHSKNVIAALGSTINQNLLKGKTFAPLIRHCDAATKNHDHILKLEENMQD